MPDHLAATKTAAPITRIPPTRAYDPSTSCNTTTPSIAPTTGSRLRKTPACDAGTRARPQFHRYVVSVVARNPDAMIDSHVSAETWTGGNPSVPITQTASISVPNVMT